VSEWASRSGQGAYFDWVAGNAMLPSEDTSHTGPAKVDRMAVTDLREISAAYLNVQDEMDKADLGLNPLGLANNVLPFDIDPDKIKNKITHFEQVHERAVSALNNAIAVFNEAVNCSQQLRSQSDSLIQFQNNVWDREVDFTNRLIEIYGYPYPEDIGPGGTYAEGYRGPDLDHFNYTDFSEITGETPPVGVQYTVTNLGTAVRPNGSLMQTARPVSYYLAENGIQTKPPTWTGKRAAPGELQNAQSDLLQARARFSRSLKEYDKLLTEIETQAALLRAQHKVNATEIYIFVKEKGVQESLNQMIFRSRAVQTVLGTVARASTIMANAIAESLPKAVGLATDAFAPARSAIMIGGAIVSEIANTGAGVASMVELHHQQAKEMAQAKQNIELTCLRQEIPILTQLAQLQQLVRQEALLRLEIYTQQEAMQQMAGRYLAALQRGLRLQEDLLRFRQQTASQVQQARYKDMAFRIFRNDNLQKYRAQFDLAAMYVYLTAKAYDYETNLRPGDRNQPGSVFFNQIVRARTIGAIVNGIPLTKQAGDGGLADAMARMSANFGVLKPQLGLLNPQKTTLNFSLKRDFMRLVSGQAWRERLATYRVADLNQVPEFKQHCLPTASEPGLVIPLQTFVNKNVNYFGWPYGPADSKFNEDAFAIRIYSVGISFDNYTTDPNSPRAMAATPDVYLIPVGNDVLRCPRSSSQDDERYTREWKILDQWLPVPFGLGDTNGNLTTAGQQLFSSSDYMPVFTSGNDKFFGNSRAYIKFRAWQTGDGPQAEGTEDFNSTLLISRSVWNTKWFLVIPASGLGSDYEESLNRFIYGGVNPVTAARDNVGVSDVRLRITAYWHSGR
jgi:hypothetical protein